MNRGRRIARHTRRNLSLVDKERFPGQPADWPDGAKWRRRPRDRSRRMAPIVARRNRSETEIWNYPGNKRAWDRSRESRTSPIVTPVRQAIVTCLWETEFRFSNRSSASTFPNAHDKTGQAFQLAWESSRTC